MTYQASKKERFHDLVIYQGSRRIKKLAQGVEKPGIEVAYIPVYKDGRDHVGAHWTKNAFEDSLKSSINTIQSLQKGDPITFELTINGKYKNLAGVLAGHIENPNRVPLPGTTTSGGTQGVAKNDYNERAAKGQALNLAMNFAIAQGKGDNDAYILSLLPRMLKLGEMAQNGNTQLATSSESTQSQQSTTNTLKKAAPTQESFNQEQDNTLIQSNTQSNSLDTIVADLDDMFGGI